MQPHTELRNQNGTIAVRLPPTAHWVTTAQAHELLNLSPRSSEMGRADVKAVIRCQSRSLYGVFSASAGVLWYLPDLMELARIRRETKLGTSPAARVMLAYREGRLAPKP